MSVGIKTKVHGLDELHRALLSLGSEVAGKGGGLVKNALNAAGRDVEARMKAGAPVDTGRLRNAIFKFRETQPRKLNEIVYIGPRLGKSRDDESGAWYAAIVEFQGGQGGKGAGFMRRSIDHGQDTKKIATNLANGINRIAKKVGNKNAQEMAARVKKL